MSDYGDLIESLRVPCVTDIHDDAIAAILALEAALASVEAERDAAVLEQEHMRRRGEQREEQLKSWVAKYEKASARLRARLDMTDADIRRVAIAVRGVSFAKIEEVIAAFLREPHG